MRRRSLPLLDNLVVDQAPLLQEGMHAHNRPYITLCSTSHRGERMSKERQTEVSAARCDGEVLIGVETVCVDHEVSIRSVASRG